MPGDDLSPHEIVISGEKHCFPSQCLCFMHVPQAPRSWCRGQKMTVLVAGFGQGVNFIHCPAQ
jgi:hypothetical protein